MDRQIKQEGKGRKIGRWIDRLTDTETRHGALKVFGTRMK